MVDMFLVPVMVGIASREVRRSPRGGAAGLEPRRITGEVGERPKVCWGTIKEGEGSSVVWLESAQECGVGGKESKERSSAPQGALPAPPRAEPTAARELLELGGPRARALYRARERGSAGQACRGRGENADLAGVSRQRRPRLADVRGLSGLPLAAANFFHLGVGAERPRGGAGCLGARGDVESSAQMSAVGWWREDTVPQHV